MDQELVRVSVFTVGESKGAPRIWLEGKYLEKAGFTKGSPINITWDHNQITINIDQLGKRTVSSKKYPVIDINNKEISKSFKISEKIKAIIRIGKIVITKAKKELRKLTTLKDRSCGSIFSGGGLLDEAAKRAGFETRWGIEVNEDFANIWQQNHPGTMFNSDISDVDFTELPHVELLIGGIPCEPFSRLRVGKNKADVIHENADLSIFFLMVVEAVNPRIIVLEEVPEYIKSNIGQTTISTLERMGYNVEHKLLCGQDIGELAIRKRLVVIASLDSKPEFPKFQNVPRTMSEILLPHDDPRCEWFDENTKPWVFKHWKDTKSKGRYFTSQIITGESTYVQTIPKKYFEGQAGNPVVKHPIKDNTYRWLTIDEVKMIMGISQQYELSQFKTVSGKVLGQGVLVNLFTKVIGNLV